MKPMPTRVARLPNHPRGPPSVIVRVRNHRSSVLGNVPSVGQVGPHKSRHRQLTLHPGAAEFLLQGQTQIVAKHLGGGVDRKEGGREVGAGGRYVDDHSSAGLLHDREDQVGHQQGGHDVDVHHPEVVFGWVILEQIESTVRDDSDVVDCNDKVGQI